MRYIIILICCLTLVSCFNQPKKENKEQTSTYVDDSTSIKNSIQNKYKIDTALVKEDSLNDNIELLQKSDDLETNLTIEYLEELLLMDKNKFEKSVNNSGYFFDKIDNYRFFKVYVFYNSQKNQYLSYNLNIDTERIYSVTIQTQNFNELDLIFNNLTKKKYTEKREETANKILYKYYKFKDINEICFYKTDNVYSLSIDNLREKNK
mgnify:CR=1 FL=1